MVAVQAETARLTTPGMPVAGAQRLSAIGDTARAALTEMRHLLGVLREDSALETAERQPQPDLAELDDLLDAAREASGTATRLILRGRPIQLDPGVELAAYRIAQEALTNARRHAPGAAVDVELHYGNQTLDLRIRDNGPGPPPTRRNDSHGLTGMRERVAAVGGQLRVGPATGGGFIVEATLPTTTRATRVNAPKPAVRIVVADDQQVVREGFAALLNTQPDFTVVGTAVDGADAVRICQEANPTSC